MLCRCSVAFTVTIMGAASLPYAEAAALPDPDEFSSSTEESTDPEPTAEYTYILNGVAYDWPSGAIKPGYRAAGNEVVINGVQASSTVVNGASYSSSTISLVDNKVSISDSTVDEVRGAINSTGSVARNQVVLTNTKVEETMNAVIGGSSSSTGSATQNSIILTDSTVAGRVYAGYNTSNKVHSISDNTVTATGSTLKGNVCGGDSSSYQAGAIVSGNRVELTDSSYKTVYGGNLSAMGEVSDNHIVITGGVGSSGSLYGGQIGNGGKLIGNSLTIRDGQANQYLYGARAGNTTSASVPEVAATYVADNAVNIFNSTISSASSLNSYSPRKIYGALLEAGNNTTTGSMSTAVGNSVTIEGSTVYAIAYGAYTKGWSSVSGNSVTVTDSTVTCAGNTAGGIYGAYGEHSGDISGNSVTVTDSTVTGEIAGGLNKSGPTATNNTVTIDGSTVVGNIYGGYCESVSQGTAVNNTVTLKSTNQSGDLSQAAIYGGYTRAEDAVSGNKLSMEGFSGTIKSVHNFDTIEQTGGEVIIKSGKLSAATSVSIKGTDADHPASLSSSATNGALSVQGAQSVSIENASLEAAGTVTIHADESIAMKDTFITAVDFLLEGEGDASTRILENVHIMLASSGTADLRNSTLRGNTTISGISSAYTMLTSSDDALTVLLDGSIVELDSSNTTVEDNGDGQYTIQTSALAGLEVQGDFTMDFTALSDELQGFECIEVQYTDTQLAPTSNVTFALDGVSYKTTQNEDGSGYTVGSADAVPEPTTATLSLLALAAMAARRRRK